MTTLYDDQQMLAEYTLFSRAMRIPHKIWKYMDFMTIILILAVFVVTSIYMIIVIYYFNL